MGWKNDEVGGKRYRVCEGVLDGVFRTIRLGRVRKMSLGNGKIVK